MCGIVCFHYLFLWFNTFIIASKSKYWFDNILWFFFFTVSETSRVLQALILLLFLFQKLMKMFVSAKTKKEPKLSGAVHLVSVGPLCCVTLLWQWLVPVTQHSPEISRQSAWFLWFVSLVKDHIFLYDTLTSCLSKISSLFLKACQNLN